MKATHANCFGFGASVTAGGAAVAAVFVVILNQNATNFKINTIHNQIEHHSWGNQKKNQL